MRIPDNDDHAAEGHEDGGACQAMVTTFLEHRGAIVAAFVQEDFAKLHGNEAKIGKLLTKAMDRLKKIQRDRRAKEQEVASGISHRCTAPVLVFCARLPDQVGSGMTALLGAGSTFCESLPPTIKKTNDGNREAGRGESSQFAKEHRPEG
jgi:hypothetical protein